MSVSEDRIGPLESAEPQRAASISVDGWSPSIRALNNDNHLDALKLVRLLKLHYGAQPPFAGAYSTEFWCHSRGIEAESSRLISIVAEEDDHFIAHVALERDPVTSSVQVLLPAVDPEFNSRLIQIIRAFWSSIELQAQRQGWKMIFGYSVGMQPLLQMMSAKCYNAEAVAIVPAGHNNAWQYLSVDEGEQGEGLILMCNVLDAGVPSSLAVYPPAAHVEVIRTLYKGIRLDREFVASETPDLEPLPDDTASTGRFRRFNEADPNLKGVSGRSNQRFGLYQLRICPSALSDIARTLTFIERIESHRNKIGQRMNVQVALDDPECPRFCGYLEQRGFRFCGIIPAASGKDAVVYSRFSDNELKETALHTAHAKMLHEYLLRGRIVN